MDDDLADFKLTPLGKQAALVLSRLDNVIQMIALSQKGVPAVQAVGKDLLRIDDAMSRTEVKQLLGRWVREVMLANGWAPVGVAGVVTGHLFSSGVVFARRAPVAPATGTKAPLVAGPL